MVKDKNGTEIKIGDTVHYYRPESTHEYDYGDGRTRTGTRPARDVVFTVDEFVDSPFVKVEATKFRLIYLSIYPGLCLSFPL